MSDETEEHLRAAARKLGAARALLADGYPEDAAGEAYFAMLNVAQAALSERGHRAKTHRGTWTLFGQYFVKSELVDPIHRDAANRAQLYRETADYARGGATLEQAKTTVKEAEAFIAAVCQAVGMTDPLRFRGPESDS